MTGASGRSGTLRLAYLLVAAAALANSGCLLIAAGAAGGTAAYYYVKGKVCQTYSASLGDAWAATHTALRELGMPLVKAENDALTGFVESRTADGERVRIYLEVEPSRIPAEGEQTRVCVRVATFGDQWVSARILDQVSLHLAPVTVLPPPVLASPEQQPPASSSSPSPVIQPAGVLPQTEPPPLLPAEPAHRQGDRPAGDVTPPPSPGA